MKSFVLTLADRIAIGVLGATTVATAAVYSSLPVRIATHFDWHGQPDAWMPRAAAVVMLPAMALVLWSVLRLALPRQHRAGMPAVSAGTVAFLCILHLCLLARAKDPAFDLVRATCAACGVFYVALGLWMPRLRQNPLAGVRTPWTLRSPEVWSRTQRFAGRLFCAGGLLALGAAWVAPHLALACVLAASLATTAATVVYSWRISATMA